MRRADYLDPSLPSQRRTELLLAEMTLEEKIGQMCQYVGETAAPTAENADEVVVVDKGRIVQRGPHLTLVQEAGSTYAGLHASWVAQHG